MKKDIKVKIKQFAEELKRFNAADELEMDKVFEEYSKYENPAQKMIDDWMKVDETTRKQVMEDSVRRLNERMNLLITKLPLF